MAEDDADQRSEAPTDRRLADAAKRGDVALAGEMRLAVMLGATWLACGTVLAGAAGDALRFGGTLLGSAGEIRVAPDTAGRVALRSAEALARVGGPVLLVLFAGALALGPLQGRLVFAPQRLALKWSRLNPAAGLSRLIGKQALGAHGRMLARLGLLGGACWWALRPMAATIAMAPQNDAGWLAQMLATALARLFGTAAAMAALLALLDLVWTRRSFLKRLAMTRQEIRQEHKDSDGDPMLRARRRALHRARARRRMMNAVPKATVVIANPTHYAVALAYEHGVSVAPTVVAKGVDALALRIRAIAEQAGVPVVENPAAARTLHALCEVDDQIPAETYHMVAAIIRYVMTRRTASASL